MDNFLNLLDENITLGMEQGTYFDVKDMSDSFYTITYNLITFSLENSILKDKICETLSIMNDPISISLKLKDQVIPFTDYLNNYTSTLGLLFFKNNENNKFREIIENGMKFIRLNSHEIRDNHEIRPYIRIIGLWIFKWMPDSELLEIVKDILKNEGATGSSGKSGDGLEGNKEDMYQELYPKLTTTYWNLKIPFKNENALIKPFNDIQEEFNEINIVLFNFEDIDAFERFFPANNLFPTVPTTQYLSFLLILFFFSIIIK